MDIKHVACPMRVKTLAEDGEFSGYGSVFGALDLQNEIVERGAFLKSLKNWRDQGRAPAMLWMHNPSQPVGLWLSLAEDGNGLAVTGKLALRTQRGAEAYELMKMGALTGLSIGYRVVTSRVDAKRKARILTEVDLFEVSLVTFPANEAARITAVKSPQLAKPVTKPPAKLSSAERQELKAAASRLNQAARNLTTRP